MAEYRLIGGIGVDSGTVLVCDPCYTQTDIPFEGNCREVIVAPPGGNGVILQTYSGDGNYPVWGFFDDDGRCMRVTIDFTCTERAGEVTENGDEWYERGEEHGAVDLSAQNSPASRDLLNVIDQILGGGGRND